MSTFFPSVLLGKLQSAKLQTAFVIAVLLAVERTTSLLHCDRWCLSRCSAQFSDKNTLCSSHCYGKSVRYQKVCLQLRSMNVLQCLLLMCPVLQCLLLMCPVFSVWAKFDKIYCNNDAKWFLTELLKGVYHHRHHVHEGLGVFPVPWSSKWNCSLHLFLGRPMFLPPFFVYIVALVLVLYLCPSSVRVVATYPGTVLSPLLCSVLLKGVISPPKLRALWP